MVKSLFGYYYLEFGIGDDGCQTSVLRPSHRWTDHIAVAAVLALCLRDHVAQSHC